MAWKPIRQLSEKVGTGNTDRTRTVSESVLAAVELQIDGCSGCDIASDVAFGAMVRCFLPERSQERLTLERTPRCPKCGAPLDERSLVCWD